jgi:hypothetical protein
VIESGPGMHASFTLGFRETRHPRVLGIGCFGDRLMSRAAGTAGLRVIDEILEALCDSTEGLAILQAVSQIDRRQGQWQPSTERQSDPYGGPSADCNCVEDTSPIAPVGRQENIVAAHKRRERAFAGLRNNDMNAQELADKFTAKIAVAAVEKNRPTEIAADNVEKRTADVEHCKRALEQQVLPFLEELKHLMGDQQFSFAPQIELNDHRPVGVSFKVGDGAPTTITTAFGNIVVTRIGDSGTSKGVPFVYAPDVEPYISNSGDLTRATKSRSLWRW